MGPIAAFGVIKLLLKETRHKEKIAFLHTFAAYGTTALFNEEVINTHDPDSHPHLYTVTWINEQSAVEKYAGNYEELIGQQWNQLYQLTYDQWDVFENIDAFVPNCTETEPVIAYIPELRRKITLASIAYGKNLLARHINDMDANCAKQMTNLFQAAEDNSLIISVGIH